MTPAKEKIRIRDINAAFLKGVIDAQDTYAEPWAYDFFAVAVWVEDDESDTSIYEKGWKREDFIECPEVVKWLEGSGKDMSDWSEEDINDFISREIVDGVECVEVFMNSKTLLEDLEDIVHDIQRDYLPDDIVMIY